MNRTSIIDLLTLNCVWRVKRGYDFTYAPFASALQLIDLSLGIYAVMVCVMSAVFTMNGVPAKTFKTKSFWVLNLANSSWSTKLTNDCFWHLRHQFFRLKWLIHLDRTALKRNFTKILDSLSMTAEKNKLTAYSSKTPTSIHKFINKFITAFCTNTDFWLALNGIQLQMHASIYPL